MSPQSSCDQGDGLDEVHVLETSKQSNESFLAKLAEIAQKPDSVALVTEVSTLASQLKKS